MKRLGSLGIAVFAALVLAPSARADATGPTGAVDGYRSPADGTLTLGVHGRASGTTTLEDATVSLDGTALASAPLCSPAQPCQLGEASLSLNTKDFPDGLHHLVVTVSDSDGNVGTVLDHADFEIWNNRPQSPCTATQFSCTATLTVGSGVPPAPTPVASPGGGGVLGATAGSCVKPKLSMRLSQRPLRIRKGVPVLVKGKRYRFTGRLTCLIDGRRVSAPKRTRIELRAIVHGRSVHKGRASVGSHGRIVVRIACPSSRTLEFRFATPDKKLTRVRIKVRTVKVARHRKHSKH